MPHENGLAVMEWINIFANVVGLGFCAFLLIKVIPSMRREHKEERDQWREDIKRAYDKFDVTAMEFNNTVKEYIQAEQTTQHHLATLEKTIAEMTSRS